MKKLFFLFLIFIPVLSFSQSKTELKNEISSLKMEIKKMNEYISDLEKQLEYYQKQSTRKGIEEISIDTVATKQNQCKATTLSGKRCSRTAKPGKEYCWQHLKIKENESNYSGNGNSSNSGTYNGRKIYTGPRGGKYYINSKGNKVYIKR